MITTAHRLDMTALTMRFVRNAYTDLQTGNVRCEYQGEPIEAGQLRFANLLPQWLYDEVKKQQYKKVRRYKPV